MSVLHQISGCENRARKADVIFVHGLGGDAFGTWRDGEEDSNSWPRWLGEEFTNVGVWSLGYAASPSKWPRVRGWFSKLGRDSGYSMALPDRALQVLDLMVQRGVGERPLLFVCHSLGGLLVKQILRKADETFEPRKHQVATNTRAVLFLATPHAGAMLASLVNAFHTVFGATVSMEDLQAHDAHLRDLFAWYRNHADALGINTVTYYETRGIGGVLPIVNPTSSHPGVGADPVPLDEDHISIAKPRSRDAQICGAARDLLNIILAQLQPQQGNSQPRSSLAASTRESQEIILKLDSTAVAGADRPRIPRELPPEAEEFFGRKTELDELIGRLGDGKNTAVVGAAGLGKTALAAEALKAVVGKNGESLGSSPFPDGVVFLDLYTYRGQAEQAWNTLANKLAGVGFLERSPARDRAAEACRARRILVIIEGGEEADGKDGRANIGELFSVLSGENRWLLLTRLATQAAPAQSVELKEALQPEDAASLLDSLTKGRVTAGARARLLELLEGHPLALTWAGNLLARDDDDPERMVRDWSTDQLPKLSDPTRAEHTLEWLFDRSVRGLDDDARSALAAAGLLARAPFPLAAMMAALHTIAGEGEAKAREALKTLAHRGLLRRSGEADHWQFTHVLGYRFARKETGSDAALRERLGHWLHEHLRTALAANAGGEEAVSLTRPLEHAAALLRADNDQRLWMPLASYVLYNTHERLVEMGRLDVAKLALRGFADWLDMFPAAKAEEFSWLRERAVLLGRQADVLSDQGDLGGALAAYRESMVVIQRLAAADPSNAGWQRDLSVGHNKLGDVLRDQGDLGGALASYRESLAVRQRLAAADPSNAARQRDLSVSQANLGDVLRDQGDLGGALAAYRESLAVFQRLAAADPSNAAWQRDLSVSQERLGDVLSDQGDLGGALAAYRESLAVRQTLAAADPSNAGWQRDLSVGHNKVGDMLSAQGDLSGALAAYRESLAVRQMLAAADPSNAGWQRDLSVGHHKLGDVLRAQGDLSGALAAYRESLAVFQRLATADPSNAGWQRDLSFSLTRMAEFQEGQTNRSEALRFAEESLEIDERLAALDPTNATWQKDVAVSRALVARLRG